MEPPATVLEALAGIDGARTLAAIAASDHDPVLQVSEDVDLAMEVSLFRH